MPHDDVVSFNCVAMSAKARNRSSGFEGLEDVKSPGVRIFRLRRAVVNPMVEDVSDGDKLPT
jgi:hypothetical protein